MEDGVSPFQGSVRGRSRVMAASPMIAACVSTRVGAMDMLEIWKSMPHGPVFKETEEPAGESDLIKNGTIAHDLAFKETEEPAGESDLINNGTMKRKKRLSEEHKGGSLKKEKKLRTQKKRAYNLSLIAGSFYIPKDITGSLCLPKDGPQIQHRGEDAHLIDSCAQVIAVADGVSSWASRGIDAGVFARKLMKNVSELVYGCGPRICVGLKLVLSEAFSRTKEKGSSTACIAKLVTNTLHTLNLGDSGFLLIRKGKIVSKSSPQQHRFNHPYQLGRFNSADRPEAADVMEMRVQFGDVVIMGTDGLFDNLFDEEIVKEVMNCLEKQAAPESTAKVLAELAHRNSLKEDWVSPFEVAAYEAGVEHCGGKHNDVTVVAAYICAQEK